MPRFVNPDNSAFQISLNSDIYVDKTELIKYTNSVIETKDAYIYNTCPRRFGKSCTANMLAAYYSKGADSFEMFSNLKIGSDTEFKMYMNHYDVIVIDVQWFVSAFKDRSQIVSSISCEVINELKEVYPDAANENIDSLSDALAQIYEKTGNRFVFIIDQWDAVLRDSLFTEPEKNEYICFMQSLFEGFVPAKYIALAWLTGILPVKDENSFLLSRFHQYTMLNPGPLVQFMGFTEGEVRELCFRYHQDYSQVKKWYGGYLLNGCELFNHHSVYRLMKFHKFNCYWSATASYEAITDLLSRNSTIPETAIKEILDGAYAEIHGIRYQMDTDKMNTYEDVLIYLVHLGYLGFDKKRNSIFIPDEDVWNSWSAVFQ